MIVALILSLTLHSFEIRQEGSFATVEECAEHMTWRMQHSDFRRDDRAIACVPKEQIEDYVRRLFGPPA